MQTKPKKKRKNDHNFFFILFLFIFIVDRILQSHRAKYQKKIGVLNLFDTIFYYTKTKRMRKYDQIRLIIGLFVKKNRKNQKKKHQLWGGKIRI